MQHAFTAELHATIRHTALNIMARRTIFTACDVMREACYTIECSTEACLLQYGGACSDTTRQAKIKYRICRSSALSRYVHWGNTKIHTTAVQALRLCGRHHFWCCCVIYPLVKEYQLQNPWVVINRVSERCNLREMNLNLSKTKTMIVFRPRIFHPQSTLY